MPFWRRRSKTSKEDGPAPRRRPSKREPVEVQIMGENTLDILQARDISTTGLGVFVVHGFEGFDLDGEVELVITLPRTRTFMARGIVRHVTTRSHLERYFGVAFTRIEPRHRAQIHRYVTAGDEELD